MKNNFQKSFTLIELLVVIAVIGLLSSIILVSLQGTRSKAQIAKILQFSSSIPHALGSEAVGIWTFDEGSGGGGTARDASGYGNNGTIIGFGFPAVYFATDTPYQIVGSSQGKYALSFDGGVNHYVNCGSGSSLNLTNSITIEMWVKPLTGGGTLMPVWRGSNRADKSPLNTQYMFYAYNASNYWSFAISNGSNWNNMDNFTTTYTVGQWQHIVGSYSYSSGNAYLYKNGVLVNQTSVGQLNGYTPAGTSNLLIGDGWNLSGSLNGLIDDVRIYSTALSASEIQQHYLAGLEKHQNLTINK